MLLYYKLYTRVYKTSTEDDQTLTKRRETLIFKLHFQGSELANIFLYDLNLALTYSKVASPLSLNQSIFLNYISVIDHFCYKLHISACCLSAE